MVKYPHVRDVIDDLLDTIPAETLNRLVSASEAQPLTEKQRYEFMSQDDLDQLAIAHRNDIENGCPNDEVLCNALFHQYSLKHQRAGASAEVAEQRAGKEALEQIRKLEEYVEEELRKQGKQRPPIKTPQPQLQTISVTIELIHILNKGWHEGCADLYVREDGQGEPVRVEPIDRWLRFVGGNDAWCVIAPKAFRSKGVWSDESADVWPNPCMTADGVRWLRDKINALVPKTGDEESDAPRGAFKPQDDKTGKKINNVLQAAQRLFGASSDKTRSEMAKTLLENKALSRGLSFERITIKKILDGSYPAMKSRGIKSPYARY